MTGQATIHLPPPSPKGRMSLEEVIARRRSVRDFTPEPLSQSQLSQVLWAAQGLSNAEGKYRTVPSAGATYPLEIFIACGENGVEGIGEGVYQYKVESHSLASHFKGDVRGELAQAALDQDFICVAPVDIIICAAYNRTLSAYRGRGERYVHVEVGHAGQNIYLQATALGLATVAIGAFHDDEVREVLRLDKQYKPLYIMPLGKPAFMRSR
jgi:SagB-type dehydrogenase family enzyme